MKTHSSILMIFLVSAISIFLISSGSCKKDEKTSNNDNGGFWNENWLLGTWEATTPPIGDPTFDNKKIRIVFEKVELKRTDTVPNNVVKEWWYSGTLTWDLDATAPWSMKFVHGDYPDGYNLFGWQSASMVQANMTINTISLRIGDTMSLDPGPEYDFDLDWGPYNDNSGKPPASLDFYGDIQIYQNGDYFTGTYPPDAGTMIRFTKK